jgi:hypothetical protein
VVALPLEGTQRSPPKGSPSYLSTTGTTLYDGATLRYYTAVPHCGTTGATLWYHTVVPHCCTTLWYYTEVLMVLHCGTTLRYHNVILH